VTFIPKVEAGCFTRSFVTGPYKSENNCLNFHHHENLKSYVLVNCVPACDCSERGSLSNVCDVESGQCSCKSNYGGRTCDICGDGYYSHPECLCKLTQWPVALLKLCIIPCFHQASCVTSPLTSW
jgi:hypothetical protein